MQAKQWRWMLWGGVGVGKTTLLRALQGGKNVCKTQMVEYEGSAIDTPGEYSETQRLARHLLSTSTDAQLLVVVHDATRDASNFSPNYFSMFRQPVIGVITKIDAPAADPERARKILREVGVQDSVYCVSAISGLGLDDLKAGLEERKGKWQRTMEQAMAKRSA